MTSGEIMNNSQQSRPIGPADFIIKTVTYKFSDRLIDLTSKSSPAVENHSADAGKETPTRSNLAKTPKADKTPKTENGVKSTPKSGGSSKSSQLHDKFKSTPKSSKNVKTESDVKCDFRPGDLIWGKLEGYPWWPCLVCNHPKQTTHTRRQGNQVLVHVQFFDSPPTRGWVKLKFCKPYEGSDCKEMKRGGTYFSADPKLRRAAEEADEALKQSTDERLCLVVVMDTSDDDNDNDDESKADDDDVNDGDVNDDDDGGKEKKKKEQMKEERQEEEMEVDNCEKENKTPPDSKGSSRKSKRCGAKNDRAVKRRRIIIQSDDDDDDYVADNKGAASDSGEEEFKPEESESDNNDDDSSGDDENDDDDDDNSFIDDDDDDDAKTKASSKKKGKKKETKVKEEQEVKGVVRKSAFSMLKSPAATKKPSASNSAKSAAKPASKSAQKSTAAANTSSASLSAEPVLTSSSPGGGAVDERNFSHLTHSFLHPDKIRDTEKRRPDDPDYNPRTLHIPDDFLASQTPAHHQWWLMKKENFDTILFFKMGKFYELFNMDAVIAVNELGLLFMRGEYAHAGFPEIAYGRYADVLIQKGYKVARVEQTETPDMMNERCKQMGRGSTKFDKVVRREICSIQTKGTKRFSFLDGDLSDSNSHYLLAICEKACLEAGGGSEYGVCFVETSVGKFYIGQFTDDRHSSRLRTLISHYPPAQVLFERGRLTDSSKTILDVHLATAIKDGLRPGTEFWDASKTLKVLAESEYFVSEEENGGEERAREYPDVLKEMIQEGDSTMQKSAGGCEMGLSALGAVVWYLKVCLLDEELLTMKQFERYVPMDEVTAGGSTGDLTDKVSTTSSPVKSQCIERPYMVLDSITMSNLEILCNNSTGTVEGTLLEKLQHCSTPFGKRLLKQWLCAPLCNVGGINARLDAVQDLIDCSPDVLSATNELLRKLPDLERLLSKIHTLGLARRSQTHPDSRAILFEDAVYSKRKIDDLLISLDGFKMASTAVDKLSAHSSNFKSKLLLKCLRSSDDLDGFPNLEQELKFFDTAFDHGKAKSEGVIKPSKGVNVNYDRAMSDIASINQELEQYLDEQKKLLRCKSLVYWGTGRNRYQMEVPDSAVKSVPDDYELTSQRKGFMRYQTEDIKDMLARMSNAEERRDAAQKDTMRCVFNQFDKRHDQWNKALQCLSVLDVLLSLAHYSRNADGFMCRPQFIASAQPFIEIRDGRHPCISRTFGGSDFIPNDTIIGIPQEDEEGADDLSAGARVVIVTGPNMGGKSTLMRQVGLTVVLAQLGCYVPAEQCRLSLVDRIFTRLGATDRIMSGESTFYVELSETSAILQHATEHSLVLLDELGRGTATYDGNAIASAVVKELSDVIQCRTLFSTHYHSLVEDFSHDKNIRLGHMACMVENENEDPSQEMITFLYKFTTGACPKSYGFNAARLAQIPDEVIRTAHKKATEFEESVTTMKLFRELWLKDDTDSGFDINDLKAALIGY